MGEAGAMFEGKAQTTRVDEAIASTHPQAFHDTEDLNCMYSSLVHVILLLLCRACDTCVPTSEASCAEFKLRAEIVTLIFLTLVSVGTCSYQTATGHTFDLTPLRKCMNIQALMCAPLMRY